MDRREMFRMLGFAGAGLGASRLVGSAMAAQSAPRATSSEEVGPTNWPFNEVRIPFRERKAKVKWPNNAKLSVRVYITTEWNTSPSHEGLSFSRRTPLYKPDLNVISKDSQYTFTVGVYRAIELVEKYGIKVSSFPNGAVVAAYPDLHKELHRLGHEITARSMDQSSPPPMLTPEQQEAVVRQVTDTIAQITGERPVGWISPGAKCTDKSPEVLVNMGYLWFGDLNGDDLPYGIKFGSKTIVAIPHRQDTTNDFSIYNRGGGNSFRSPQQAFEFFKDTFDAYYQTATSEAPTMMMYGIHPFWSCWPDRVIFHDMALRYMKGFKDVWFARHRDVAQWWKENYL